MQQLCADRCIVAVLVFTVIISVLVIFTILIDENPEINDPHRCLKELKLKNVNRIIYAQININSLHNKFKQLKSMITCVIDILVITENGFSKPHRLDRNGNRGGIINYVRENIPSRSLNIPSTSLGIECIFIEINLRKTKWLIGGVYIPQKHLVPIHLEKISCAINYYFGKYDNILIMEDFNCEMPQQEMQIFCDSYNLNNLIKCFQNPQNPSCTDLTNRSKRFMNTLVLETGLSDHHKMCITMSRAQLPKMKPNTVTYRSYKHFRKCDFKCELSNALCNQGNV